MSAKRKIPRLTRVALSTAADTGSINASEIKRDLRQAMRIRGFIPWNKTAVYTHRVECALNRLRIILTPKYAAQLIGIVEYAMALWEKYIGRIDDSDGCMGMIRDELYQLHFEACTIAKPEPLALAERIVSRTINSPWDMFYDAYETYRDIFGEEGRAHYREVVKREWEALPSIGEEEQDDELYGRTSTLKQMMLDFAESDNDLDLIIRILSRDLSYSDTYHLIAQHCRSARKYKLAREWAERGLKASTDREASMFRSFLADEYLRAKRPDDALAMIWDSFVESISLNSYTDMAKYARKRKCWDAWREKAFAHIRRDIRKQKAEFDKEQAGQPARKINAYAYWAPRSPDHTLLVSILLWEENEEEAWAEATQGGCSNHLWLKLAKLRDKSHPEDAIEIYRRQVVPLIERTNNGSYEEAVGFLGRTHTLMKGLNREEEFHTWLTQITTEYKRKRNFIKYVKCEAWGSRL